MNSKRRYRVVVTQRDMTMIANAVNESFESLDDEEYETRMEATKAEVYEMLERVLGASEEV